jgi:hypothetical protein
MKHEVQSDAEIQAFLIIEMTDHLQDGPGNIIRLPTCLIAGDTLHENPNPLGIGEHLLGEMFNFHIASLYYRLHYRLSKVYPRVRVLQRVKSFRRLYSFRAI